jgi:hypothetical protein
MLNDEIIGYECPYCRKLFIIPQISSKGKLPEHRIGEVTLVCEGSNKVGIPQTDADLPKVRSLLT